MGSDGDQHCQMFSAILTTYGLYSVISGLFFFLKLRTISDSYWPLLAIAAFGQKWPIVIFLVIFFGLLLVKMGKMDQKRQKKCDGKRQMWPKMNKYQKNEPEMDKSNPK